MRNKILALATILCVSLPAMSQAATWKLGVKVATTGGQMTVRGGTPLNFASGTVYYNYTTSAATKIAVAVAPTSSCYAIQKVAINGTATTNASTLFSSAGGASQSAVAYFYAKPLTVSASVAANGGGSVSPTAAATFTCGAPTGSLTYTFTPVAGGKVLSISGIPTGSTVTGSYNVVNGAVAVTIPAATLAALTGNNPMVGTFSAVSASAGPTQSAVFGQKVTLAGSSSDLAATYSWIPDATNLAAVVLTGATTSAPYFNAPAVAGIYYFNLTVDGTITPVAARIFVGASATDVAANMCANCHKTSGLSTAIYSNWSSSIHSRSTHAACQACHAGTADGAHPGTVNATNVEPKTFVTQIANVNGTLPKGATFCTYCHNGAHPIPHVITADTPTCTTCHSATGTGDAHQIQPSGITADASCAVCHTGSTVGTLQPTNVAKLDNCIDCHGISGGISHTGKGFVNDNNGVREIVSEFSRWSHHVTGSNLNNAHCAACHLEGKVSNGAIVIDGTKHMSDNAIHLRDAQDDSDHVWNPEAPDFSTLDNFCMSCHSAAGATSAGSVAIQTYINTNNLNYAGKTASHSNPFGDTISNQYDKLERPAVVDATGQFAMGNNSHHAVSGKKYSGRTRVGSVRAVAATFANNSGAGTGSDRGVKLPGVRSTIYDAGKFEAAYVTLANANTAETGLRNGGSTLGDDSTLHCADCHTVGQFAARGSVAFNNMSATFWANAVAVNGGKTGISRYNKGAIGAHGSANEYLLRNNIGSNERHQGVETTNSATGSYTSQGYGSKPYLVCYNCHAFQTYGSVGSGTSLNGLNHAGEYANTTRCNGSYNTGFGNMTGEARILSVDMRQVQSAQVGPPATPAVTATTYLVRTTTEYSNVFRIQCANCHNSGYSAGNIFGGIHGSKDQTYVDGMGNTTKHVRFMPGLGNVLYVPGTKGGFDGGSLASYNSYSGNRNGTGSGLTVGQTFTTLPKRTIVTGVSPATTTLINGVVVPAQIPPYLNTLPAKGNGNVITGSYQYVTGGVSHDLNWEQVSAQPIAGEYDFQAKAMGCYTLDNAATPKVVTGYNGDANKGAAAAGIQAAAAGPDGTTKMQDNWGGCDDHNNVQGGGTAPFRKVLRPVTY